MPRPLELAPPRVIVEPRADGTTLVRSPEPLAPHARAVTEWLARWAREAPERTFLTERAPDGTRTALRYGEARARVEAAAAALLALGASAERPLMILAESSIAHALFALGAQHVGVAAAPVSPAYSRLSTDHAKLRAIVELLRPAVLFVDEPAAHAAALAKLPLEGVRVIAERGAGPGHLDAGALSRGGASPDVARAHAAVGPDTVAKILFTSGSTGEPKGVINTQRMLTANQQMIAQCWPFLRARAPVLVDWLPWNHTFGANHNFFMVLAHGGTLHINHGKPVPGLVEETVANLRELSPTLYFDVPRGFDVLLPYLEADGALRERFFAELDLVFYAGAALPQSLWDRMEAVSARARGAPIPMVSAWGSTETSPLVTSVHFPIARAGVIGLPAPGCEVKLVPNAGKLEMRVRGPNVTPGYLGRPDLTAEAFDEEGFYRIGDAGRFEDPTRPEQGLVFDGRVSESFKLTTGTWVHAGTLRVALVAACSPVVQDAVITGHDRDEIGALLFPSPIEWGRAADPRAVILEGLRALDARAAGSSRAITRALVLDEPPSIDAGEITDKGYVNQRRVLERRAALVARLYDDADPEVLRP
ncbi:MAG: feruloyl-CoA synthase [Sandaracinaceae bacterium]|nr:feruloyl-CoA synthase [Sandaracinaceae bacterium]